MFGRDVAAGAAAKLRPKLSTSSSKASRQLRVKREHAGFEFNFMGSTFIQELQIGSVRSPPQKPPRPVRFGET